MFNINGLTGRLLEAMLAPETGKTRRAGDDVTIAMAVAGAKALSEGLNDPRLQDRANRDAEVALRVYRAMVAADC